MSVIRHNCAVLGYPIEHSLSPVIHRAAYRSIGSKDWVYSRCEVKSGEIPAFLKKTDSSWAGLSLTMPLKKEIFRHGQAQDYWSQKLGIANTAIFDWSKLDPANSLLLYNTDVEGIVCAIVEQLIKQCGQSKCEISSPFDPIEIIEKASSGLQCNERFGMLSDFAKAAIIGTGATACSALAALYILGFQNVHIVAHHIENAGHIENLARELGFNDIVVTSMEHGSEILIDADIVIAALPAGAADNIAWDLSKRRVNKTDKKVTAPLLLDVSYGQMDSNLARTWMTVRGGASIGGQRMLLFQAVRQIALMRTLPTSQIPIRVMDTAMKERSA